MKQRDGYSNPRDLVWLSGWVFADLMLGLFVIFLVSSRGGSPEELAAIPTSTPTFTLTVTRTATPIATWTPFPTLVPLPTYTPFPTLRPTITAIPALSIGLDQTPYYVTLRTDPTLFLSTSISDKQTADKQFRDQIHSCLDQAAGSKAGLVLATGYNPDATNGHAFAKRVISLLSDEIRDVFGGTVQKDFHALSDDPYFNGMVTLEIYFVADPRFSLPSDLLGKPCNPPPKTWCQGRESAQSLIVFNWDTFPYLMFNLDGVGFRIKPANGTPPKKEDRAIGCLMVSPGKHSWSAGEASGSFTVEQGKDPGPIWLCGSPARMCPGGALPTTTGPGSIATPVR